MTQLPLQSALTVRPASLDEARTVRHLDTVVFPAESPDLQRAEDGELEEATKVEDVFLLELRGEVAAYIHLDRQDPRWLYIAGIGVLPHLQNKGLGTFMLRSVLDECRQRITSEGRELPVYTVTSPRNARMLNVLFNLGFAGRWALPNHFGLGRHRIACQMLLPGHGLSETRRRRTAPVGSIDYLDRLLAEGWVIRRRFKDPAGRFFELVESVEVRDFPPCPRPESPELGIVKPLFLGAMA